MFGAKKYPTYRVLVKDQGANEDVLEAHRLEQYTPMDLHIQIQSLLNSYPDGVMICITKEGE